MTDNEIRASNLETYSSWVADLKKKGKTPADMVAFARSLGFEEYADRLEAFISEMQVLSEEPLS